MELVGMAGLLTVVGETQMGDLAVNEDQVTSFALKGHEASISAGFDLIFTFRNRTIPRTNGRLIYVLKDHHWRVCVLFLEIVWVAVESAS